MQLIDSYLNMLGYSSINYMQLAFSAMVAALFLQSGVDKLLNWKGEKAYLTEHFAKSPLNGMVPVALPLLTILELGAGVFSAIGFYSVALGHGTMLGLMGMLFAVKAVFFLFLGQRLAKDYAGAASLVPYFLLCAGGLYFFLQA